MQRQPIAFISDSKETILAMSENIPGAIAVIAKCREFIVDKLGCDSSVYVDILKNLDSMNMRGSQIWVAFNDYAKKDISRFLSAVQSLDPKMIDFVNNHLGVGSPESKPIAVNPLSR